MTYKELATILKEDLNHFSGENRIVIKILTILFNMSYRVMLNYRLGFFLANRRNIFTNVLILFLKKRQIIKRNCDISYHAKIGRRISFPHPLSIVIGDKVTIGDDVMIWQEVTLGSHGKEELLNNYPTIGNGVKLFSGCKILGKVTIGDNAKIGACTLVLKDVPSNTTAYGIPSKFKSHKKN